VLALCHGPHTSLPHSPILSPLLRAVQLDTAAPLPFFPAAPGKIAPIAAAPISSCRAHSPAAMSVQSPPPIHLHCLSSPTVRACAGHRLRALPSALSVSTAPSAFRPDLTGTLPSRTLLLAIGMFPSHKRLPPAIRR
jgi:hypothetical protein